jgi:hypothetical protein
LGNTLGRVMLGVFEKRDITWGDLGSGFLLHLKNRDASLRKCVRAVYDKRTASTGWQDGGAVDGQPARVRQRGDRVEALHGGPGKPNDDGHGHIVSNDGLNASMVREPGGYVVADDSKDSPYEGYQSNNPRHNF